MTPFRISFAGGGSDLPSFYRASPGCVVSATINKHMYLFVHPSFDQKIQIKYSRTERVDRIDEVRHPIVRETLRIFGLTGIDISSIADIPAGTGLGSSSAFAVGLLHALHGYVGEGATADRLADEACRVEIDILKEPIGRQDQYASAFGGLNFITFSGEDDVAVHPITMPGATLRQLERNLVMFYMGGTRDARGILEEQSRSMEHEAKRATLVAMTAIAAQLRESLAAGRHEDMGEALHEGWRLKKSLSNRISADGLDRFYEIARKNGASGGKLLGAGGQGFFLFYCREEDQPKLRASLAPLREMPFDFDARGSRLILPG